MIRSIVVAAVAVAGARHGVRVGSSDAVRPKRIEAARALAAPRRPPRRPGGAGAEFDLGVWTVHASAVDANFKTGDFSTPAKVVMTREGGDVTADRANGNYKTQIVYLNGHVVMHDQKGDYGGLAERPSAAVERAFDADCRQSSDRR